MEHTDYYFWLYLTIVIRIETKAISQRERLHSSSVRQDILRDSCTRLLSGCIQSRCQARSALASRHNRAGPWTVASMQVINCGMSSYWSP